MNTKYEFEPHQCEETGVWYCRKLVNMSLPEQYGEFEDKADCEVTCDRLNEINEYLDFLKTYHNIKLEVREVK
jgi:hypothetical protein